MAEWHKKRHTTNTTASFCFEVTSSVGSIHCGAVCLWHSCTQPCRLQEVTSGGLFPSLCSNQLSSGINSSSKAFSSTKAVGRRTKGSAVAPTRKRVTEYAKGCAMSCLRATSVAPSTRILQEKPVREVNEFDQIPRSSKTLYQVLSLCKTSFQLGYGYKSVPMQPHRRVFLLPAFL